MLIIPAIDLKDGKCVRLLQGNKDAVTTYSDDPSSTAKLWESCGATLLHVVDLDGAFTGEQKNLEAIRKIRDTVSMEIEVGGGIRDMGKIEDLIAIGITRIILGTVAVEKPSLVAEACQRYPGRILVGIDARDGKVAVKGWVEVTAADAKALAKDAARKGAAGIIYTDISTDGMMTGPNVPAVEEMVMTVDIPVIASGGLSSLGDIRRLLAVRNLWGVITGKAIYSGALDLREAIRISEDRGKG
ncbi:MAG TPA: 1-(5-phosphoribosyl)-5-[(5-phosphoribosylamino)methylideneamino]imidazole-4-carboxamide isomerase [Thermodesulfovibrionales bacterium]|jgi:phosphoribosylformimino-5-aminoimidazole carboxamide ribotide isomerase|nr:1-(5-phosphoribosyl)-5-[(5-phosphoribosylamino)methylideneamino]imidazole-4-carboxamide isomerase [Thermodesulfovibrionales bacterium]